MAYHVEIVEGNIANCSIGRRLQRETYRIILLIKKLTGQTDFSGADIFLKFETDYIRGAEAKIQIDGENECITSLVKNGCRELKTISEELKEGWKCEENKQNKIGLLSLANAVNELRLNLVGGLNTLSAFLLRKEGEVTFEDIEDYVVHPAHDGEIFTVVDMVRENQDSPLTFEQKESLIHQMQSVFGHLAQTTSLTLGEYDSSRRIITIYIQALKERYGEKYIKEACFGVFAHYLFYAVLMDQVTHRFVSPQQERIVLESLSSYFEYRYYNFKPSEENQDILSKENFKYCSKRLYGTLKSTNVIDFPCSGVVGLIDLKQNYTDKDFLFQRAYRKSVQNLYWGYCNIIAAYETSSGQVDVAKHVKDLPNRDQWWNSDEFFAGHPHARSRQLYDDMFSRLREKAPYVCSRATKDLGYINIYDKRANRSNDCEKAVASVGTNETREILIVETQVPGKIVKGLQVKENITAKGVIYTAMIKSQSEAQQAADWLASVCEQMV